MSDIQWMTHSLGRLEGTITAGFLGVHQRIDDQDRYLGNRISLIEKRMDRLKHPLAQLGTMAMIAAMSILALVRPELAVHILRGLLH